MRAHRHTEHRRGERAVTLVEVSIGLPLLLLGIYGVVFFAATLNARGSLMSAVSNGARLAFTRSVEAEMGVTLIPEVQAYLNSGSATGALDQLLATPGLESSAFAPGGGWYLGAWNSTLDLNSDISKLPSSYLYALVYTYRHFRQSVGGSVRYPCDPHDPVNGAGCLRCTNLNATTGSRAPSPSGSPVLGDSDYDLNAVGVSCEYRPADYFITPLLRFVSGGALGKIIIERNYLFRFTA